MHSCSLSTVWNIERHDNAARLIEEVRSLGFSSVELNFKVPLSMFAQFEEAVARREIRITSTHNYCPVPAGHAVEAANPDVPDLASIDEQTRKEAVLLTRDSIIAAARVGAAALVVHSGKVTSEARTRYIIEIIKTAGKKKKKFKKVQNDAVAERREKQKEHFDALCTSYSELVPVAREHNIVLGVENRFHYRELPSVAEFTALFRYFDPAVLRYWHDVGHAYILEQLGFYPENAFFASFYKRMAGMHIHDIIDLQDHQTPGSGVFKWDYFKRYDLRDIIKVFEVHHWNSSGGIKDAAAWFDSEIIPVKRA